MNKIKKTFTLIEMIFVIIIVSVITIGAKNALPDNTLINGTNYLKTIILDKRANAMAYETNLSDANDTFLVCVKFDKDWLEENELKSKVKVHIPKRITITSDNNVCFDYMGRPHKNSINLSDFSTLAHDDIDVNVTYNNKKKTIRIYPMTGFTEIRNN